MQCSHFIPPGILPFWRGNLVNCLGYLPTQVLSFAFKDKFKDLFKVSKTDCYAVKFCKNIASGGAAGVLSLWFVYSLHYCRIRLANDVKIGNKRQFKGIIDVYRKTLSSDGIVGLYRGFIISCVGIFVYRGCYFGFYDTLKPIFLGENAGTFASLCLGFGVTISAGLVSYPLDTIHSRMMMRSCEAVKYKGSLDCFMQIVRNEGYMALMRGAGVSILRGIFGAGLLAGFDKCKKYYRTKYM